MVNFLQNKSIENVSDKLSETNKKVVRDRTKERRVSFKKVSNIVLNLVSTEAEDIDAKTIFTIFRLIKSVVSLYLNKIGHYNYSNSTILI